MLPPDHPRLPFSALEALAPRFFPLLTKLNLTRRGEPLVDPNFLSILNLAAQYEVKIDINTNGVLLTRALSEQIIPHLRDVKVSYDGASPETFEHIRSGISHAQVIRNIKNFIAARERFFAENGIRSSPTITLEVTLRRDNILEFPRIITQGAEWGVDLVKGYHLFAFHQALAPLSLVHEKALYNAIFSECQDLARDLGIKVLMDRSFMLEPGPIESEEKPCPYIWRKMWVDFNGDVLACNHPSRNKIGNIYQSALEDLWNSPTYQDLRAGKNPICISCGNRVRVPMEQPIPYDDNYFVNTGAIHKAYQRGDTSPESTAGLEWPIFWSRRTAQLNFPQELGDLSRV